MSALPSQLSNNDLDTLAKAGVIPHGTPEAILRVFAMTSQQHGLSPFKKEIYLVKYGSQYNTIVGIDGLRSKAGRTGTFAGRDDARFDVSAAGSFKTAAELVAAKQKPVSCTVTVWKLIGGQRCPFSKTVLFSEYCPASGGGKWATMPFNMIEKCAEAAALRMAFADETAGLHIEEEAAAFKDTTIAAAETRPELAIDIDVLAARIADTQTVDSLAALYKSSPLHAAYAELFTQRKEEILDALQMAGKI
jgi:phage recombination protein Bet